MLAQVNPEAVNQFALSQGKPLVPPESVFEAMRRVVSNEVKPNGHKYGGCIAFVYEVASNIDSC